MPLAAGDKIGPYEILAPLGEGGMGQVWKARDTRLNRMVAIKQNHTRFNERFEREAQAVAALNHPHICQLYDVGPDYLVMEYVEGKPLVSPEKPGPMPVNEALALAGQILDALDAAHRKGITHRDLKPGNILVGKSGVKILDFGLAKIEREKTAASDVTETMPLTSEGTILGTLQYMSPEQIEGQEADARSDIFAFGLVLYEMLTGQRAFTGKTRTSLVASILKDQPRPLKELQPLTPPSLERVIQTCLEKDPDKRWQSARELKHALEWITSETPAAPEKKARGAHLAWVLAGAFAVVAVGALWLLWPKTTTPARSTRFQLALPENVDFNSYVSVSPDGHKIVFLATGTLGGLWIHHLDTLEWRRLDGTEGARSPFWSPDSRFLAFVIGAGDLRKIEVAGGAAQTLCSVPGAGSGSWNSDGVIVFGNVANGPLHRVSASGGTPTDVTTVDTAQGETFHGLPSFLPDGKHFVYLRSGPREIRGIYAGSLDAKPSDQSRERILATGFAAPYVAGNLFFMREHTLMTQPFDAGKLRLTGEPIQVAQDVGTVGSIGIFSVSTNGVLAYRSGTSQANFEHVWFDRSGKATGKFPDPSPDRGLALSPDGAFAAARDAVPNSIGDIWMLDLNRGIRTRFTFNQIAGSYPVWSPDGARVIFTIGPHAEGMYEKAANGAGDQRAVFKSPNEVMLPSSWSRDGRFLLYSTILASQSGNDVWVLPMEGERKPVLLLGSPANEGVASFSPDGRWIAYGSNESGQFQIYVRPFVASGPSGGPSLGEGKWQVSKDGAGIDAGLATATATPPPRWRSDSKEIIFRAPNGSPMSVEVDGSGAAFQIKGVPQQLFAAPPNNDWDVTADGKRFLMTVQPTQQGSQVPITVVLNWQAGLKK